MKVWGNGWRRSHFPNSIMNAIIYGVDIYLTNLSRNLESCSSSNPRFCPHGCFCSDFDGDL